MINLPWPDVVPLGQQEVQLYWGRVGAMLEIGADNLSEGEMKRAEVFRFERDRKAFLARRGVLRLLLGRHSGLDPAALLIESGPHGKPFLPVDPGLCFNSSHSADLFLIAMTRGAELGVDLQEHRLGEQPSKMAEGVFTQKERVQLQNGAKTAQKDLFFRGWTRKEAALKALGTGFMQEARELYVGLGEAPGSGEPWSVPGEPKLLGHRLLDLAAPAGFSAALSVQGDHWSLRRFELPD